MITATWLRKIVYFLILLVILSSFKHFQSVRYIKQLETLLSSLEAQQISSEKISSDLTETKSDLDFCKRNTESLTKKIKKTRESVSTGFASLKVCNANNDNCEREKLEGITNIKLLEEKLKNVDAQLSNLTQSLISKTNREKQLAEKLEDLRRLNGKERAETFKLKNKEISQT